MKRDISSIEHFYFWEHVLFSTIVVISKNERQSSFAQTKARLTAVLRERGQASGEVLLWNGALIRRTTGNHWPCPRAWWVGHPGRVWQGTAGSWHSSAEGAWKSWSLEEAEWQACRISHMESPITRPLRAFYAGCRKIKWAGVEDQPLLWWRKWREGIPSLHCPRVR